MQIIFKVLYKYYVFKYVITLVLKSLYGFVKIIIFLEF
jgi:hypothetical protein